MVERTRRRREKNRGIEIDSGEEECYSGRG